MNTREQAREIAKWCEHADKSLHPIENRERFACVDCIAAALAEAQAGLRAYEQAVRDLFEASEKAMSYPQCQEYGIPFTAEVAAANTRKAEALARLKALILGAAPSREAAE